jgi:hypothetical protein
LAGSRINAPAAQSVLDKPQARFQTSSDAFNHVGEDKIMNALRITLFILAVLELTTQSIRHVYVYILEPRTSVLDKFEQSETTKTIQKALSLEELVAQYEPAKKRVDELDKQRQEAEAGKSKDERDVFRDKFAEQHKEEYSRQSELKGAICEWEKRSKEISELRVLWSFGLALFVIGASLWVRRQRWLGLSFIIPGVVEMIWWTSPSLSSGGCPVEFDRLLINKIIFTLLTLALVIVAWFVDDKMENARSSHEAPESTA